MTTELSRSGCDGSISPLLLSSVLGSSLVTAVVVDFAIGGGCEICGDSVAVAPVAELEVAEAADDDGGFGCEFIELDVEDVVVVEEDIGELVLLIGAAIACCEVGGCIGGAPELLGDCCCCCGCGCGAGCCCCCGGGGCCCCCCGGKGCLGP